jgi:hypothetical protein
MGANFALLCYLKAILKEAITTTQVVMNMIIIEARDLKNLFKVI